MRRAIDITLAVGALVLSACILWPKPGMPIFLILLAVAVAVLIRWSSMTNYVRTAATGLLGVMLTSVVRPMIGMPGEMPAFADSRSVWLVALIVTFSIFATPALWWNVRPASAVTSSVTATFLAPISDTSFYSVRPPVLLQLGVIVAAMLLVAFVPLRRWGARVALLYVAIEPVLIALAAWVIVAPFVRAESSVLLGLAMRHFLALFGVPAAIVAAVLGIHISNASPEQIQDVR